MRRTLVRAGWPGVLLACALAGGPAAAATPHPDTPGWNTVERASAQFRAFHADSAMPILEGVLASPEAARDPALAASARLILGSCYAVMSRPRDAEPMLRAAARHAEAAGESLALGHALRYLGYSLGLLGRGEEAAETNARLLEVSLADRDTLNEAYARLGLAYHDLLSGRFAEGERGYLRALPLFRAKGEEFLARNGMIGLGRCYEGLDRLDEARRCYAEVDSLCLAAGDPNNRASALNNLGAIEHMTGDLAAAERYYRAAYEMYRDRPTSLEAVTPATNLALVQIEMGRRRDAGVVLEDALARARRGGYLLGIAQVLNRLTQLKTLEHRYPEALAYARQGLALADSVPAKQRTDMVWTFGAALEEAGERAEAIRVLAAESALLGEHSPAYATGGLRLQLSATLAREGRHRESLRAARLALADGRRSRSIDLEFRARVKEGLALAALGRVAEARATLETATALWEANRQRQRDPEAREHLSEIARECVSGLIAMHLAAGEATGAGGAGRAAAGGSDARAADVFAVIERFRARTLRERMAGPWKAPAPLDSVSRPMTLADFQRSVLREGELYLDTFLGPTARVIVAMTSRESRIAILPADDGLPGRLVQFRSLCATPHSGGDQVRFVDEAGRHLGEALLEPLRDLVAASRRVIVSPDEALGLTPWAALVAPEPDSAPGGSTAALLAREVVLVPSAGILADLRRREGVAPGNRNARVLAVAGPTAVPAGAMPGAEREVRWLADRFTGVVARRGVDAATVAASGRFEPFDVLHFAAHTSLDDESPWRSGIRLRAAATPGRDDFLRAERIASLRLNARLAVLSSCESAGGRIVSGEGVQGLSAAFISAGVTTTVATLWPVSDRVTEQLMRTFYERLANGQTVSAALRSAQLELRGRAATRHPFYWAGFVVLGDGDVRIPLRRRLFSVPLTIAIAVAVGAALLAAQRQRSRSPLTNATGPTLIP